MQSRLILLPLLLILAAALPAQSPPQDVAVDRIEVVQVVQDSSNSVPLIAGKRTVVRVFASVKNPAATPQPGVTCTLKAMRDGGEVPGEPRLLVPGAATVPAPPIDRDLTAHSINFELPAEWVRPGVVELTAELTLAGDPAPANNTFTAAPVRFAASRYPAPLDNPWIRACYQPDLAAATCPPTSVWPAYLGTAAPTAAPIAAMEQLFPVPDGGVRFRRWSKLAKPWRTPLDPDGSAALLDWLNTLRAHAVAQGRDVADSLFTAILPEGTILGTPDRRLAPGRAFVDNLVSLAVAQPDAASTALVHAHEAGHALGLEHPGTPDDGDTIGATPEYWRQAPDTRSAAIQEPGFDVAAGAAIPRARFDLMSFRFPQWISPFHYGRLLEPARLAPAARAAAAGTPDIAVLTGWIARDASAAALDPAFRFRTPNVLLRPSTAGADTCFRFFDDAAQPTGEYCFRPAYHDSDGITPDRLRFALPVPVPANSTRVALFAGAAELAALSAASGPSPVVNIASPLAGARLVGSERLTWTASSPDGKPIATSVQYSIDGGANWDVWDVEPARAEFAFHAGDLPAGDNIYLRVTVSNGWNNASNTIGPLIALPSPRAEFNPTPVDYGTLDLTASAERAIAFSSSGNAALAIINARVEGPGFTLVSQPPSEMDPGAASVFRVRFQPPTGGVQQGALIIQCNDAETPVIRIALQGAGTGAAPAPRIAVSPARLDFGPVTAGQSRDLTLDLRNTGGSALAISSIAAADNRFSLPGVLFPLSLAPAETRSVTVRFSPPANTAASADVATTLAIASNDPASPTVAIVLAGRAEAPVTTGEPRIEITPPSLDYGNVEIGKSRDLNLTVRNTGAQPLAVGQFQTSNPAFRVVSPTAPAVSIAPGDSLTVTVRFAPTVGGSLVAGLVIQTNDPQRPQATVALTGAGATVTTINSPRIEVSPSFLDFGAITVGDSRSLPLTIRNAGTAPLVVSQIAVSGAQFGFTAATAAPFTLLPGATSTVNVRMTPAAPGTQTGGLTIRSNDLVNGVLTVNLTGLGRGASNETLRLDDGTYESYAFQGRGDVYYANRLTPPSYPATLRSIRIYFGRDTIAAGQPITVVWADTPVGNDLSLIRLKSLAARVVRDEGFSEYILPVPVTITTGDFLVGFADSEGNRHTVALDTSSAFRERSYTSTNGFTFQLVNSSGLTAGNFGIHAVVSLDIR